MGLAAGKKIGLLQHSLVLGTAFSIALSSQLALPSLAQEGDSSSGASSSGSSAAGDDKPFTPVNGLQGLFQMQPQYPSPGTTQMFPEPTSANMGKDSDVQGRQPGSASNTYQMQWAPDPNAAKPEEKITPENPLKGLFQMQPQYPSPGKTQMFPEATPAHLGKDGDVQGRNPGTASNTFQTQWKDPSASPAEPSKDQTNYLKGLFQMQPQYPSPGKTQMFPEAVQGNLGKDSDQPGRQPGSTGTVYQTPVPETTADAGLPSNFLSGGEKKEGEGADKDKEKESGAAAGGAGEKKEGEKKEGESADKDKEKDGEKKEGEKKEGESADKDKEKDGEKKEGEKKEGESADKDKEKDGEKKEGEAKKDDKDSKDKEKSSDKKDDKDKDKKEEKKEEVKYAPYNPLREAISLMNSNRLEESIALLSREIKKQANNPQAFYTRAVVYVKMRKYELAAEDYNQVLKLAPTGQLSSLAKAGLAKIRL